MVRLAANPILPALTLILLVASMSAAQTPATGRLTGRFMWQEESDHLRS